MPNNSRQRVIIPVDVYISNFEIIQRYEDLFMKQSINHNVLAVVCAVLLATTALFAKHNQEFDVVSAMRTKIESDKNAVHSDVDGAPYRYKSVFEISNSGQLLKEETKVYKTGFHSKPERQERVVAQGSAAKVVEVKHTVETGSLTLTEREPLSGKVLSTQTVSITNA